MTTPKLCEGLGMPACYACAQNADNHPDIEEYTLLRPAASPPKCMDWKAMPVTAPTSTDGGV